MSSPTSLEKGLGSVRAVSVHYCESLVANGVDARAVDTLAKAIEECYASAELLWALRAVIAAWHNSRVLCTGRLYVLDAGGELRDEYIISTPTREAMVVLMSD